MLFILLLLFLVAAAIFIAYRRSHNKHRISGGMEIDLSQLKNIKIPDFDVPEIHTPAYL